MMFVMAPAGLCQGVGYQPGAMQNSRLPAGLPGESLSCIVHNISHNCTVGCTVPMHCLLSLFSDRVAW